MKRNYILHKFLARYWAWLEAGAPGYTFSRHMGLCGNLTIAMGAYSEDEVALAGYMLSQLLDHEHFPFNTESGYYRASAKGTMHTNKRRIKFVREVLGK